MTVSATRLLLRELTSLAGPLPDFDPDTAEATPQAQFLAWLREAIAAGVREPHAMTLGTVAPDGRPDARVLILKDLDAHGWHFATSRHSPKGAQLANNASATLTFYWPALGRQVRIRGEVIDQGADVAAADFWARSEQARANASLARQSQPMDPEASSSPAGISESAAGWVVYAVRPSAVEFWQGRTDRRHTRLLYTPDREGWTKEQLWP
ncbi:MAG: hypothetical protein ABS76_01090 [Pelagibacterium sp. SCN 64-44]|nr:MAG: hypothetical protein ABS76_01090 [Pelagibacterium sp. SCN 64-44]